MPHTIYLHEVFVSPLSFEKKLHGAFRTQRYMPLYYTSLSQNKQLLRY